MGKQLSNVSYMKEIRRELRRQETQAETVLWSALRGRRLANVKFRRQHSFGHFVVDFYCAEYKLVIEVDGSVHNTPDSRLYDTERELALCSLGLTIMRFTNQDVLDNLEQTLLKIRDCLQ